MNIPTTAAEATTFTRSQLSDRIGTAVAVLSLGAQRQAGSAVLQMLSAAASVGRPSTAAVNGLGGTVDVVA